MQHVDRFHEILRILSGEPALAHGAVRFLSTGMMGDDWDEHVCLEMALGEGYVLNVLYGLIDTLEHDEIRGILVRATRQEERHVAFGETETMRSVRENPNVTTRLLGLSLWSLVGIDALARGVRRRATEDHPVIRQFPEFLAHVRRSTELRLERMGLIEKPISEMGFWTRSSKMALAAAGHGVRRVWPGRRARLTKTYLNDRRLQSSGLKDLEKVSRKEA